MRSACPVDAGQLSVRTAEGLDVVGCQACGGAWLPATSAGALLARLAAVSPPQQRFFDKLRLEGRDSRTACIECGTAMRVIGHGGVEVDVCQDCGGIWFDGGELQRFRHHGVAKGSPVAVPASMAAPSRAAGPAKGKPAKAGAAIAGATVLAASAAAGAAALKEGRPAQQPDGAVSVVGDVAEGVLEVGGEVAGSVFFGILECIFS